MSRRKAAPKRYILPDPLFKSELVTKFINVVMNGGKKSIAEKIVYGALQRLAEQEQRSGGGGDGDGGDEGGGSGTKTARPIKGDINTSKAVRELALQGFEKALENARPSVEVKSRRVGGSNYQVPIEVRAERRVALAMRWLVQYAAKRGEKTMVHRLAGELIDAIQSRGGAVKKRQDTHRMAEANKAFAHYRW